MGRAACVARIAALLLFAAAAACSGPGGDPTPTPSPATSPTPTVTDVATPSPTPTPPPDDDALPARDLVDLARRFRGLPPDAPLVARETPFDHSIGDRAQFTVLDLSGPSLDTITATVRLVTDHAYFFVEDGVEVSASALQRIGDDFESLVYPRVTDAFGPVRAPGVDGDERISIVHGDLRGAGGYVTSADQYPASVAPRSNEREAIYLDASFLGSPGASYNAVLAHELQHLVHLNAAATEESWVNEGLSQIAAELVGGGTSALAGFLAAPDTQLTDWPQGGGVHYGESQLFFRYLLDRFGGRESPDLSGLLAEPADGIAGVDAYLEKFGASFLDVFADWLVANYLDEPSGPYAHEGISAGVAALTTVTAAGEDEGTVHQFAADYLEVEPPAADSLFSFDGSDQVGVGIDPVDGPFWWSGAGDDIDSRLTREFDLRGLDAATLRYRIWFSTELGWDYAYVAASTDGGQTWQALPGRHTSDFDPVGLAYGPGYTGSSDGEWPQEEVDLTPFAGQKVLLRFEYITDDATHEPGLAVDDIAIPELGFFDDGSSSGGWRAEGFRRDTGPRPQEFIVQLIDRGDGAAVVRRLELAAGNRAEVTLDGPVTIVVAAVTDETKEEATYRWSLDGP